MIFSGWRAASHPAPYLPPCSSSAQNDKSKSSRSSTPFLRRILLAINCAVSSALQSDAPRPYTLPLATVALNGGYVHFVSSSIGTTSKCAMNMSPACPDRPRTRATMFPRPGADSMISLSTPSAPNQSLMYSQTAVSLPVGMNPVLTDGMRTRSCSNRTMSSCASST